MRGQTADKQALFETMPVGRALMIMAVPTILSQLIILIYNIADTWFIGQTNNHYMVAASSLVATVFMMISAVACLFGTGGGNLVIRLIAEKREDEARRVSAISLYMAGGTAIVISLLCLAFMDPLLNALGASANTIGYARQYMSFVIILGSLPVILSQTMSFMLRNLGYSREAAIGMGMGGLLNVALDPLFMFVILPDGYQVMGAAVATLLSNVATLVYFIIIYRKARRESVLEFPGRIRRVHASSMKRLFIVGLPAALSVLFYDLCNMTINMLSATHGDAELAAMGIVLKVERFPLNVGIGLCLAMMPLVAYNCSSGNKERMFAFFKRARTVGLIIAFISVAAYFTLAPFIIQAFIADKTVVSLGAAFLQARCFATPLMFLSFHMVNFMQAVEHGKIAFFLAFIRQLCLNIPILILFNYLWGMTGIIWTQVTADFINVIISYLIYGRVKGQLAAQTGQAAG